MHLLAAQPGGFSDEEGIVDLGQSPADIVILSAADDVLGMLADCAERLPADYPSLRLANSLNLAKPAALDLYRDRVIDHARLVVVSLIGGRGYWPYGIEQLEEWAAERPDRQLIVVSGEDYDDTSLLETGTVAVEQGRRVWRYLRQGGPGNAEALLRYLAAEFLGYDFEWSEPRTLPRTLIHHPCRDAPTLADWQGDWVADRPVAVLLFYRSHVQTGNTAMFNDLISLLVEHGINPLPVAVASLKERACLDTVNDLAQEAGASIVLNTTGFALMAAGNAAGASDPGSGSSPFPSHMPVLQLIVSQSSEADWQRQYQGLRTRDMAMQVVLPELDGRIITRAISFKALARYSERCQLDIVRYQLQAERAGFVAELARRWCLLQRRPNADKRIALVLANYPSRDGRIGNAVGLDTPRSTMTLLHALADAGYRVGEMPEDSTALMRELQAALTNDPETIDLSPCLQSLDLATYEAWFARLPESSRAAVRERWGEPSEDPKYRHGRLMVAGMRLGNVFVGPQPARGYGIDQSAYYHDGELVPPHGYLAFYCWLREVYGIDAVINVGKHGNLEWLPGKGAALSATCWPDIALGPMPTLYPFIVNDPGEGAQAKRRSQAVIIDHMTPPIVRAETHGTLAELEGLVDEYFEAMGMDERRERHLREQILDLARRSHVADELPVPPEENGCDYTLLKALDAYICDLKEAQIRGGLHCLGELPDRRKLAETLVSLVRLPRGDRPEDAGILHALAADLELGDGFDPLRADAEPWEGPRPEALAAQSADAWRSGNDTRERLEQYALDLLERTIVGGEPGPTAADGFARTAALLAYLRNTLMPALDRGVGDEIRHTLAGLDGRFVPPGPSGAPTRGRLDTLPTGRNFYTVDSRAIPTPTAWELGQASAEQMIARHLQDHGDYPRQIGLSVWGTSTMRTGGDDIAQAFALLGVRPIWAAGSSRVVDFEIMPGFQLGRPRVDVTLRVSGFFRDAFPNVMRLFDAAVQSLADFEEPGDTNTIRGHVQARAEVLEEAGASADEARRQAGFRVFGAQPGAYGSGMQGAIEEGDWDTRDDLARQYVDGGGYAYGQETFGEAAFEAFSDRLGQLEAVVQNQDNREHDILDSNDYFQFQGGMANAVRHLGGSAPAIYHGDHSNPAAPRMRTLKEELNRVVRSRVTNPKWIEAMREHGYKGAFEMAASVDYLFAYDATTGLVDDYQYESVSEALVHDTDNQQFLREHNPRALQEMSERLVEAMQRGLWADPGDHRERTESLLLELDEGRERGE
ncbi:MAG: cobaltochelatase subunit CobN [Halofilum sp. (in: g-proteobacteria)]|nr:cobaltochelatase subunit CobN [Halofilum sp. (in: g-proteobacteria)]